MGCHLALTMTSISQGTTYLGSFDSVVLSANFLSLPCMICIHFSVADADKKRTESDHTEILVTTQLEKVRDLRLEAATDSSLTVKWDPVKVVSSMTYRLEIKYVVLAEGDEQEFNRIVDVPGDRKEDTLADLSSGRAYVVSVTSLAKTVKDNEATSDAVKATFMTKPSTPTGLKPTKDGTSIQFMPSSKAQDYIVKWHLEPNSSIEETPKTDSLTVTKPQDQKDEDTVTVLTTKNMPGLTPGIYTISVCSRVTDNGITAQSNDLMESFILSEGVWSKADTAELDLVNMVCFLRSVSLSLLYLLRNIAYFYRAGRQVDQNLTT